MTTKQLAPANAEGISFEDVIFDALTKRYGDDHPFSHRGMSQVAAEAVQGALAAAPASPEGWETIIDRWTGVWAEMLRFQRAREGGCAAQRTYNRLASKLAQERPQKRKRRGKRGGKKRKTRSLRRGA